MNRFVLNRFQQERPSWDNREYAPFGDDDAFAFHKSLPHYHPTPLFSLPALAHQLGVGQILVKDESYRFDLNAFKVLGASSAIYRFMTGVMAVESSEPFDILEFMKDARRAPWADKFTFCTATDGNHGRAVAWTAKRFGQKAVIYMPKGTVPARIRNIEAEGARVEIIEGTYDDAVKKIAIDAAQNGWQVISDTAYPGYLTVPGQIMAGYVTMFKEMEGKILGGESADVDIVFLQAGVGSFAAAAGWYYIARYGSSRPKLVSVEPVEAACLLESSLTPDGRPTTAKGSFTTIMAGLNCGTPSIIAWPIIRDSFDLFLAVTDEYAAEAMRRYYHPPGDDPHIVSGESGAAGLAALLALVRDDGLREAREKLGLGMTSRILLVNTEGATDPEHFRHVVELR